MMMTVLLVLLVLMVLLMMGMMMGMMMMVLLMMGMVMMGMMVTDERVIRILLSAHCVPGTAFGAFTVKFAQTLQRS